MSVAFKQVKVYARLGLVLTVIAAVGSVLMSNRNHRVSVWFFGLTDSTRPINVVWLMLWTAGGTLVTWWVLSLGWGIRRDMRDIKRWRGINAATKNLDQRAVELEKKEQRIDEKLQRGGAGDEMSEGK